MTTRVAAVMGERVTPRDARSFVIREVGNSLSRSDPISRFTAASLVARDASYLEPDLTKELKKSIGNSSVRWAQVLGNLLLRYPNQALTITEVNAAKTSIDVLHYDGLPLARLALGHLRGVSRATRLVWEALLQDVPGFADGPYPLFGMKVRHLGVLRALPDPLLQRSRLGEAFRKCSSMTGRAPLTLLPR